MKKRVIASLILFLVGLFFILNSKANITGAVVGVSLSSTLSSGIGVFLILISGIIFMTGPSELERKIKLTSTIKKDNSLKRLTEEATKNEQVQREVNHLLKELSKGNLEAGLGHPGNIEGTNIFYLRARRGGRLYYRKTKEGYEILAKSAKGNNQDQVLNRLRKLYSH